jgi:hypothetical protein
MAIVGTEEKGGIKQNSILVTIGEKHMTVVEKQQLLMEGLMLEMYLALPNTREIDPKSQTFISYDIRDKNSQTYKEARARKSTILSC